MGAQESRAQAPYQTLQSQIFQQDGQSNESHEGHEGSGHEGNEEEDLEQDRYWKDGQGDGSPRKQSKDHWRVEGIRSDQEQERQGCEQKAERKGKEEPLDGGCQESTCSAQNQRLCCDQKGFTSLPQSKGVLRLSRVTRS